MHTFSATRHHQGHGLFDIQGTVSAFKTWFAEYTKTFQSGSLEDQQNIEMIRDALPRSEKISEIYSTVQPYLKEHCQVSEGRKFTIG